MPTRPPSEAPHPFATHTPYRPRLTLHPHSYAVPVRHTEQPATPFRTPSNAPTRLLSVLGFRWWRAEELVEARETVFPPRLGELLMGLLKGGAPERPVDIGEAET